MKVFRVSNKCNACGQCMLNTDLLIEDQEGKAVPAVGKFISENDLDNANEIVANCPVGALSVCSGLSVDKQGKAGALELAKVMESKMSAVKLPEKKDFNLKINAHQYDVDYRDNGGSGYDYSSYEKAKKAGAQKLYDNYMCRFNDILLSILVQMKNDKLKPLLKSNSNNVYLQIDAEMQNILKQIKMEALEITNNEINLPDDFTSWKVCKQYQDKSTLNYPIEHFEDQYNHNGIATKMKKSGYDRQSFYETYIDVDDMEVYDGKGFWGDKHKTKYCYYSLFEAADEYIDNVKCSIEWSDLDEAIEYLVENVTHYLKQDVDEAIQKKANVFKKAAEAL